MFELARLRCVRLPRSSFLVQCGGRRIQLQPQAVDASKSLSNLVGSSLVLENADARPTHCWSYAETMSLHMGYVPIRTAPYLIPASGVSSLSDPAFMLFNLSPWRLPKCTLRAGERKLFRSNQGFYCHRLWGERRLDQPSEEPCQPKKHIILDFKPGKHINASGQCAHVNDPRYDQSSS